MKTIKSVIHTVNVMVAPESTPVFTFTRSFTGRKATSRARMDALKEAHLARPAITHADITSPDGTVDHYVFVDGEPALLPVVEAAPLPSCLSVMTFEPGIDEAGLPGAPDPKPAKKKSKKTKPAADAPAPAADAPIARPAMIPTPPADETPPPSTYRQTTRMGLRDEEADTSETDNARPVKELSERHQEACIRMLSRGMDPIDVRMVFGAVPELVKCKRLAEAFCIDALNTRVDEILAAETEFKGEIHARRSRMQRRLLDEARRKAEDLATTPDDSAPSKNDAPAPAPVKDKKAKKDKPASDAPAPSKKTLFGHAATTIMRWCGANGIPLEDTSTAIQRLTMFPVNPATLKIQHGAGRTGKTERGPIPMLSKDDVAAIKKAIKG